VGFYFCFAAVKNAVAAKKKREEESEEAQETCGR
jgi:hypothetical protein